MSRAPRKIAILGSTGSIGTAALEIVLESPEDFEVVGLAAGENDALLASQLALFPRARFAMGSDGACERVIAAGDDIAGRCEGSGEAGIMGMIESDPPDLVLNALVGVAGLVPTARSLSNGCDVALANKESLVIGGEIIERIKEDPGSGSIIPVDSEHFSLSRCLAGFEDNTVEIILTASGGPFLGRKREDLAEVTVSQVLDHPTWSMGRKVTVDSALLLNKGLEVIEAHWLFGFPYESIGVVIHPQSRVHGLARLRDGSLLAHIGPADMRLPLMNALYRPDMLEFPWESVSLEELADLEFHLFERSEFPAFELAMRAAESGQTYPAVLNAADETAVRAFLEGRIGFLAITDWIEEALAAHDPSRAGSIEDVLEADAWTREYLAGRHSEAGP